MIIEVVRSNGERTVYEVVDSWRLDATTPYGGKSKEGQSVALGNLGGVGPQEVDSVQGRLGDRALERRNGIL